MEIKFTNVWNASEDSRPQPASKFVPDWYKDIPTRTEKRGFPYNDEVTSAPVPFEDSTIKKCMPVFDAMTAGYIIPTPYDLYITKHEGEPWYQWPSGEFIQFHSILQAPNHPMSNGFVYPKFINSWAVKTPPGYSCLFIQPLHRPSVFNILPGVVDTDTFDDVVNFPFVITDLEFDGIIPAGTPMAQIIPFKRDSWHTTFGGEQEVKNTVIARRKIRRRFSNVYKDLWRQKKEYL